MTLTESRKDVLFSIAKGNTTIREIQADLGMKSPNGAAHHLEVLRKMGLVTWEPHRCRTLQLTTTGWLYVRPPESFEFLPCIRSHAGLSRILG